MFSYRLSDHSGISNNYKMQFNIILKCKNKYFFPTDELDDTTPLPELTLYDLLEPTTSKEQQVKAAADVANNAAANRDDIEEDNEDEGEDEEFLSVSANDSLNTPRTKKAPTVRILENKRLSGPAPIGTALKNMLGGPIKVVTTQPTKQTTQVTDVKILNKLQTQPMKTFGNAPIKIGNTTIAAPTAAAGAVAAGATVSPKSFSGVTMTQIKTADGKVLFVQKSLPGAAGGIGQKVTVTGTSAAPRVLNQATTVSTASGIRQTVLPKGVTITSTGLIKTNTSSPIAVRGLTTIASTKSTAPQQTATTTVSTVTAAPATSPTVVANNVPIKVVRTPDGKLIKLNQGAPSVLLNAKPSTVAVRPAGSTATTTVGNKSGNVVINKPTAQVIIKGPLKQLPSGASIRPVINSTGNSTTTTTTATTTSSSILSVTTTATTSGGTAGTPTGTTGAGGTATAAGALPAGKMLLEGPTGKQIVVATKNIIKLSPSNSAPTLATTSINTPSGLHAIQLPGKSGVQYVRVLPNTGNNSGGGNKVVISPQKVPLGRPRTSSNSKSSNPTVSVSNTSKIVMKTMGGSIVPLPSMHTLVPRVSSVLFWI